METTLNRVIGMLEKLRFNYNFILESAGTKINKLNRFRLCRRGWLSFASTYFLNITLQFLKTSIRFEVGVNVYRDNSPSVKQEDVY